MNLTWIVAAACGRRRRRGGGGTPADPVVTTVVVTPNPFTVNEGDTEQLTAQSYDQYGSPIVDTHTWGSSDTDIATVDSSGEVTGVDAGSVVITATSVTNPSKSGTSDGVSNGGIDWSTRGLHPDHFIGDDFTTYTGANDAARTVALQANISTALGGTNNTGTALYTDGDYAELASITSAITLDGHPVADYHQPPVSAGGGTPELWHTFAAAKDSVWVRCKTRFPVGWTRHGTGAGASGADGYKLYGFPWGGGMERRSSVEFNGSSVYTVMNLQSPDTVSVRANTGDLKFTEIPDPITVAQWHDFIFLSYKVDATTRRLLTWYALDGSEPQLAGDQYLCNSAGSMPAVGGLQLGMNLNRALADAQDQHLYHGQWEAVDYATNPDPWKLVQALGGSVAGIAMPGRMTVTSITGTVNPGDTDADLVVAGTNFDDAPSGYFGVQLSNADSTTPLVINGFTYDSPTQLTVSIDATDTPVGTYALSVIPTPGYPGLAASQTIPSSFDVGNVDAPVLTSITPNALVQGETNQDLAVVGLNFVNGDDAVFSNAGITVNSTTFNSSTSLTANVDVDPAAATGAGTVKINNAIEGDSNTRPFTVNASGGGESEDSRHYAAASSDVCSIEDPAGVSVAGAFTIGSWVYANSHGSDGRGIMRIGPLSGTLDRGVHLATNFQGHLKCWQSNAQATNGGTDIGTGAWVRVGATRGGSGVAHLKVILNGVQDGDENTDPLTDITTGDGLTLGSPLAETGADYWDGKLAWSFLLVGVALSAAALDGYLQDPQSLINDYGPSGSVTANALKIFWTQQCDDGTTEVDASGQGNDGTYDGPTFGSGDGPAPSTGFDPCA